MPALQIITKLLWIILCGALIVSACDALPSQTTPTVEAPDPVDVIPLVSATGVVVPSEWTTLSMSTAGMVDEVLVVKGDTVEADQVLVRLKGKEDLSAAIAAAQHEVNAAQQALDDLNTGADDARVEALQRISAATRQVRDAQYQLDNFTIPTDQADLEPMEALDMTKERLDQAREAFEPFRYKSEYNQTRKDSKKDLDRAQSDYNAAVRRVEYVNELEIAEANLEKARGDYGIYEKGPDPNDVALAESRLDNANASLASAQAKLEDLELHALFAGTVSELYIRAGEWVQPGEAILQMADLGNLRVETTDLNEIDAARVTVGDSVKVTFDALPDEMVAGTVESIAPKASAGSGVNYTVVIELAEWPETLRWGMTAFVDIEVGS